MHKFMVNLYGIYELCLARLGIHVYFEHDLTGQWLVNYNALQCIRNPPIEACGGKNDTVFPDTSYIRWLNLDQINQSRRGIEI